MCYAELLTPNVEWSNIILEADIRIARSQPEWPGKNTNENKNIRTYLLKSDKRLYVRLTHFAKPSSTHSPSFSWLLVDRSVAS